MTLFIGAYYPDKALESSIFGEAITRVAVKLAQSRDHKLQSTSPNLDFYFLLPSETAQPDFQGMRIHSFDKATDTLRIESSVPEHMVSSKHAEDYVVASLSDAVDNAFEFFSDTNTAVLFQRDEYQSLVESLRTMSTVKTTTTVN